MSAYEGTPDGRMATEEEELTEDVAETARGSGGRKRCIGGSNPPQTAKRPRYNDKSFGDLTLNDIEGIVREVNMLKRQSAAKEEELTTLREVRTEKAALAKQVKALEAEVASSRRETEKCKTAIKDQDDDVAVQASRLVKALRQTLSMQMVYVSAFKDQLCGDGRDIVAFAANVSPEVAKAVGVEPGSKNKYSDAFFGEQITKTSNGTKLAMLRMMSVKYYKTTYELRIDAAYATEGAKKQAKKQMPASKVKGAADGDEAVGEEAEDQEMEGVAGEGDGEDLD